MATTRDIRVFRYEPGSGDSGHFDNFSLEIPDGTTTTILDVLLRLQEEQDPTIAFRFACRVNMCGSCGMVINGIEGLGCKMNVSDIPAGKEITLRPMNHFPVIKDLVVDMDPFFHKYDQILPYFEPKEASAQPALIPPDSRERLHIGGATECIACGCCVSSCTMVYYHEGYAGPAALNRAFTLLADSRDGLRDERLARALESCYDCRTEFNCTEVCPKNISPTRAIKYIQRMALTRAPVAVLPRASSEIPESAPPVETYRRTFLRTLRARLARVARLFAVPFLGRTRRAGLASRPLAMATGVTAVVAIVYLSLMSFEGARAYGQIVVVPDRRLTATEQRGLHLFVQLQCAWCHQIRGQGGHRTGPDLSNVVAKRRTRDYLASYIRNPQAVSSTSVMPKYKLPQPDLETLADFVLALDFSRYAPKIVRRDQTNHLD